LVQRERPGPQDLPGPPGPPDFKEQAGPRERLELPVFKEMQDQRARPEPLVLTEPRGRLVPRDRQAFKVRPGLRVQPGPQAIMEQRARPEPPA
jgi:hypothetical protein